MLWPDHCVWNSHGAALSDDLDIPHGQLILRKGYNRAIDSYSGFQEADRETLTGLAGYLSSVTIDWRIAGMVTAAAVLGALVGSRLTALVNPDSLRKVFGWVVLVMSSVILFEEVHPALGIGMVAVTIVAAIVYYVRRRRLRDTPPGKLEMAET